MKNFIGTWLIVAILSVVGIVVLGAVLQGWGLFLLLTGGIAGLITAGVSFSEKLEQMQQRLNKLTGEEPSPDSKISPFPENTPAKSEEN